MFPYNEVNRSAFCNVYLKKYNKPLVDIEEHISRTEHFFDINKTTVEAVLDSNKRIPNLKIKFINDSLNNKNKRKKFKKKLSKSKLSCVVNEYMQPVISNKKVINLSEKKNNVIAKENGLKQTNKRKWRTNRKYV